MYSEPSVARLPIGDVPLPMLLGFVSTSHALEADQEHVAPVELPDVRRVGRERREPLWVESDR